jgi:GT2 family glycosyltransferase
VSISLIVVNWNAGSHLASCLTSLPRNIDGQIIVVDNASTDGSEQAIADHPGVTLIRSPDNLGFGRACNLGARFANGEFLLFLNPDAAVFPNTLDAVLTYMQNPANAQVGICGVQLVDESGHVSRSCARFPSAAGFVAVAVGLDRLFPRLGHFMAEWCHDSTQDVAHVIGAFYLVRHKVFEELGGFDERFFVYLEDLDFSFRARQAGWRSVYLADVQAFHVGGGTSHQVKALRLFYSLRSRLLYVTKHFSLAGAALVLFSTLLLEPFSRTTLALTRRSWPAVKETWHAYVMLWRWLPHWVLKGVTK